MSFNIYYYTYYYINEYTIIYMHSPMVSQDGEMPFDDSWMNVNYMRCVQNVIVSMFILFCVCYLFFI